MFYLVAADRSWYATSTRSDNLCTASSKEPACSVSGAAEACESAEAAVSDLLGLQGSEARPRGKDLTCGLSLVLLSG